MKFELFSFNLMLEVSWHELKENNLKRIEKIFEEMKLKFFGFILKHLLPLTKIL